MVVSKKQNFEDDNEPESESDLPKLGFDLHSLLPPVIPSVPLMS